MILLLLFLIARFIAGRSIKPISAIIQTADIITRDNLKSRITLPNNKDELHLLSGTINNLLDRVENAIEREKQFTSDASHELRTPLAVIKGTLEVLIRKPRNVDEYKEKIDFCIKEVNRLNHLVDELLLLARFEHQKQSLKLGKVSLNNLCEEIVKRNTIAIEEKEIKCNINFSEPYFVQSDSYLFSIVINNIITNAIKYSHKGGIINFEVRKSKSDIVLTVSDQGIGIAQEDLEKIFDQFYRSKSIQNPKIKGTGLGLSIVKRICFMLDVALEIKSEENIGTVVSFTFQK
jgi:signal transduction histidine kinase